jgi:phosphopantothenoylcysteine decarboxylase
VSTRVLYIIVCAAPPARDVSRLISAALDRGWDTCLLATPAAMRFLDVPALAQQTGHPVRSDYKDPLTRTFFPRPTRLSSLPPR